MKDADLDAKETPQQAGLKLLVGHLVQVRSRVERYRKWNAEAKYGRFDASYIEEGRTRTKGAEVCSLHNYSKLQCFLPIGEGEGVGPQPPAL